jgi:Zn-dependent protease with chaperone function
MFNNIIYLIIVLAVFQLNYPVEGLFRSPVSPVFILFLVWLSFTLYCRYRFSSLLSLYEMGGPRVDKGQASSAYQSAVTKLSILSIALFALSVYLLNIKFWLLKIPGFVTFSTLPGAVAIIVFFTFLISVWYYSYPVYRLLFDAPVKRRAYIRSKIKLNLPVIFPWAILSIGYDLLSLLKWPALEKVLDKEIGQFIFFAVFLVLLLLFMPPFIKYWWGCTSLPQSEKKEGIVDFFRQVGFKYRDIVTWPILEGQVMTAGVMGLLPRFRYILLTESLLNILSEDELKAVMAHEIGHIKYKHILFYAFFLLGYMVISFGLFDVFFYLMAMHPRLLSLLTSQKEADAGVFYSIFSLPFVLSIILYFRYVMGFFMRNFERQADFFSVQLLGRAEPIIMSLEKIAHASSQSRFHPSWHHFSIAERVEALWKSTLDPSLIKRHSKRLVLSLVAVLVLVSSLGYTLNFGPLKTNLENIALTHILNRQLTDSPEDSEIYKALAYVYHQREKLAKAKWAYENAIRLNPDDALSLNNLAWILATAEDTALLDYTKALTLAKRAVLIERSPTFLDTLAEAYYVNGFYDKALQISKEALDNASERRDYFADQVRRFREKAQGF